MTPVAEVSKIEWTDSTFNPWIGCTKVSAACDFCYAETLMDHRYGRVQWGQHGERKRTKTWGDPMRWQRQAAEFYAANGRRRRVFCASLADIWDNQVPVQWHYDLLRLIHDCPDLDWLLLTKRPQNILKMLRMARAPFFHGGCGGHLTFGEWLDRWIGGDPPRQVWLGISTENQTEADRRIPIILEVPARIRFLSCEPLLGPLDLRAIAYQDGNLDALTGDLWGGSGTGAFARGIDWVIAGGESGTQARPTHPDWFRGLRDQCGAANVPFLFKQWGEWISVSESEGPGAHHRFDDGATVRRLGKKAAGRLLGGVEYSEFPS